MPVENSGFFTKFGHIDSIRYCAIYYNIVATSLLLVFVVCEQDLLYESDLYLKLIILGS